MSSPFLITCQPWELGFELESRNLPSFSFVSASSAQSVAEKKEEEGKGRGAGGKPRETVRRWREFPPRRRTFKNSGLLCEKKRISSPHPQINFTESSIVYLPGPPSSRFSIFRRKVWNLQADRETGQIVARGPSFQLSRTGFNCCSRAKTGHFQLFSIVARKLFA